MLKHQVEKKELIYEGFCDFRLDTLKTDTDSFIYNVLVSKQDAVAILAKTDDNRYLITREYRHPIEKFLLGLPGGRLEDNEDPLKAAERELLEETGYKAKSLKILKASYPLPALCDQKVYYIQAIGIEKVQEQKLDPLEEISTDLFTKDQIHDQIKENEVDGVLLTAFGIESFCS